MTTTNRRRRVFLDNLVGQGQIAERAEVSVGAVYKWQQRFGPESKHPFPEAVWEANPEAESVNHRGRVWNWPDVARWLRQRRGATR